MPEIKKILKFKAINSELSTEPKGLIGMHYPQISFNFEIYFHTYD